MPETLHLKLIERRGIIILLFVIFPLLTVFSKGTQKSYTFPEKQNLIIKEKSDCTPLVAALLSRIDRDRPAKIVFKKGVYHFYPDKAVGFYHEITNHDNGFYQFAFPLCKFSQIEIDGQGSEFIFHGQMIPFLIKESSGIVLSNLTIDWEVPHYIQGKILAKNQENSTIDMEVAEEFRVKQQGNQLTFGSEGWEHTFLGDNIVFDAQTKAPVYNTMQYYIPYNENKNIVSEQLSPTVFRLTATFNKQLPPVNSIITFKGITHFNRTSPAIHLKASKNVTLHNITIHHAGGMGVIAEKTENIHLDKVDVMLRENSDRMVTTTADATHFCNCKGSLIIENCTFENMLDDATNVHGTYLRIKEIADARTVYASISHFHQYGYDFAQAGDTVRFVSDSTLLPLSKNKIASVDKINDRYYRIRFEQQLPDELKVNDGIENITWYPETIIRNNIVRNNRARGFLISSGKPVLIEHNSISSQMSAILFEGDMNYWFESGAVSDVTIRNNFFVDCSYSGYKQPVIFINPMMKKHTDRPYEKNIRIENNSFRSFDSYILDAKSVEGLFFNNNVIEKTNTWLPLWNTMPMINITQSKQVEIMHNTAPGYPEITISLDKKTQSTTKLIQQQ
ncbi:MAG: right-handed parallel beta-helix repeat-containing protein [Paludibacter sp.]|nr:right-handed parallel beta-helix repeat-containing protein [Paludibacter sp.]